jgi:hypothetical protein
MNESLGGVSRITFQMSVAAMAHEKMARSIEILGGDVAPIVSRALRDQAARPAAL